MPIKPYSCLGCALHSHGNDFSGIEGTGRNGVMVVAEASGDGEVRDGLPLRPWSPAGGVFERTLRRLGLDRQDFAITNQIRCKPRQNLLAGMPYESSAVQQCRPHLEDAYLKHLPRVILALGNTSFSWLTGYGQSGMSITQLRGYVFTPSAGYSVKIAEDADTRNVVIVPTYHPSFIRRGSSHLFGVFARDVMRAVNIASGKDHSFVLDDPIMAVYREELNYILKPTIDEAWAWYMRAKDRPESIISYDLETFETASLEEDARDGFADTRIRQIQFSIDEAEGIALPWNEEFRKVIAAIMALANPKCGFNCFGFDNRVLRAVSEAAGNPNLYMPQGRLHDVMLMWKRWQPELPANLQYAASFVSFPFAWKHLNEQNLPFYGVADTDSCLRLFNMLSRSMAQHGILEAYTYQVADLHDLPATIAGNGLTVSRDEALLVTSDLAAKQSAIIAELDQLYPESERTYSPEEGYKKTPKEVEQRRRLWDSERMGILIGERTVLDDEPEEAYIKRTLGMVEHQFIVKLKNPSTTCYEKVVATRWCKPNPVSPMSRQQIMKYAKVKKHEIPTKKQPDGSVSESLTLGDIELMFGRTRDRFYGLIAQHRRLTEDKKMVGELELLAGRGTVHSTFAINPDGSIGARNPGLPEPISEAARVIVARPGNVFIKWVWPNQWEHVAANLIGDLGLSELLQEFAQPYVAAWDLHKIHPAAFKGFLSGETDRAILDANRVIFGTSLKSIGDMRKRFTELYPGVAKWQSAIRQRAHGQTYLKSRFGEIRWFYEVKAPDGKGGMGPGEQSKGAVEFLPQADTAGLMKWRLREMKMAGIMRDFSMVAMARDWMIFESPTEKWSKHVSQVYKLASAMPDQMSEMTRLSLEVWGGRSWSGMTKLNII